MVYHLAESKYGGVLRGRFGFGIPVVSDDLKICRSVYDTVQRCWAHILCEAREDNVHGRVAQLLYVELKKLFARIKA